MALLYFSFVARVMAPSDPGMPDLEYKNVLNKFCLGKVHRVRSSAPCRMLLTMRTQQSDFRYLSFRHESSAEALVRRVAPYDLAHLIELPKASSRGPTYCVTL